MSSEIKQLIAKYASECRVAQQHDKVYKDECAYSYDTPETSETGLYICLRTFVAVSRPYLDVHMAKSPQSHLYLRVKTRRIRQQQQLTTTMTGDSKELEKKKPTRLALGVDDGFDLNAKQFYLEIDYALYVHPECVELRLGNDGSSADELDERVAKSIQSVIKAESQMMKEELASAAASWDGEKRFMTKHAANLLQLPSPPQISSNPATWKCEICGLNTNIWLNLSDGKMMCGRRQLDGSGGNNHAVEHYQRTKYPLAVKLGTITASQADVYSYDEDDMVDDPNLAVHLAHFGINMSKMEKTEKTMTELEIDLNQRVGEWDRIQESGSKLVPVYGPGFTGLRNLGNSCYMNSILQVLFSLPEFVSKYVDTRDSYIKNSPVDPSNHFNFQLSKVGYGLLSGRYSNKECDEPVDENSSILGPPKGIKPTSFKSIIGRGHAEFASKRQQDAHEFLGYLFDQIDKNARTAEGHGEPLNAFRFELEDRVECSQSHQVKYKKRGELCLSVPISKDLALNKAELAEFEKKKMHLKETGGRLESGELVRPQIRLEDCLRLLTQEEVIADFYSSAVKRKVDAIKTTKVATFPDYLLIHMKKFELAPDWTPIKLDVSLQVPDVLNLKEFRSTGLKPNEVELKDDEAVLNAPEVKLNEEIIGQLMDMGFSLEGSKRAVYNTRDANNSEAAVNWAVAHMEDTDFNTPFIVPGSQQPKKVEIKSDQKTVYDEDAINSIVSFGFTRRQAMKALDATGHNLERAADWVFNHSDEIMDVDETASSAAAAAASSGTITANSSIKDGNEVYKLIAFVSHMGPNANVGHYVAHILKGDRWVIFNDENVALSENPPKDLAYLYLYKRID